MHTTDASRMMPLAIMLKNTSAFRNANAPTLGPPAVPTSLSLLANGGDQRLATLDFPSESILSRVRCIASFGLAR